MHLPIALPLHLPSSNLLIQCAGEDLSAISGSAFAETSTGCPTPPYRCIYQLPCRCVYRLQICLFNARERTCPPLADPPLRKPPRVAPLRLVDASTNCLAVASTVFKSAYSMRGRGLVRH